MANLKMELGDRSYTITVKRGAIGSLKEFINPERKLFVLTDSGVPREYAEAVCAQFPNSKIFTVEEGEGSKSIARLEAVLFAMLDFGMSRADAAVAVGGGVVGDLMGFAASVYMRGIDFYNIPTTLLSQVDSSIGGKTAVNLGGIKNTVGSFYQPKGVFIDTDTLKTLPKRQISAGLAEAVKMSLTSDAELFEIFENEDICEENIEKIIVRSLMIKKSVVECDEKERGLRKVLNFGHTLGHGIESESNMSGLYHGECVALGMIPMCAPAVRNRLIPVLKKLSLPTEYSRDINKALEFVVHDKKCSGGKLDAIFVDEIGSFRTERLTVEDFTTLIKKGGL